jgi:hypothetical protein
MDRATTELLDDPCQQGTQFFCGGDGFVSQQFKNRKPNKQEESLKKRKFFFFFCVETSEQQAK